MTEIKDILHINVEYFTGLEEEDDVGYPYYVASCEEIVAVTDGETWNELMKNIKEMLEVAFDEEDTVAVYGIIPNPKIVITMELPENYAEIA